MIDSEQTHNRFSAFNPTFFKKTIYLSKNKPKPEL